MSEVKREVAEIDKRFLQMLRQNIVQFMQVSGTAYDREGLLVLDIAPQDHEGASPFFPKARSETLDINPTSGATYIADLCENNSEIILGERFDIVVCTEVLEHTLNPFDAADEIRRVLKPNGLALISVPFNFRIHGPLPDCWRISEHGLKSIFSAKRGFQIVTLTALEDEDRFLMPIHYTLTVRKI
jgi:SAM-dependent methyltransferase